MAPAPVNTDPTMAGGGGGEEKQKLLDREIRDMISMLTNRLSDLHKQNRPAAGGSSQDDADADDDDERGIRIITLAGTNTGASMRGSQLQDDKQVRGGGSDGENEEAAVGVGTYVNSNYQSVNNSIMMGGGYSTNDPGVHVDVSQDFLEQQRDAGGLDLAKPTAKDTSKQQSATTSEEAAARS